MLTVDEARERVLAAAAALPAEEVALDRAHRRVLAADVRAAGHVPPFANSAMDGYAVRAGPAGRRLQVVGESRAGAPATVALGAGEAVAISTGAAMPQGADAVLPVEDAEADGQTVVPTIDLAPGRHVRAAGEDVRAGDSVLSAGTRLGAAGVGLAALAGHATVRCARAPRLAIVATGDELVAAGRPLGPGQIHDSNAVALAALAVDAGAAVVAVEHARDEPGATRGAIAAALEGADVVCVSGGVSVGPHDHVKGALDALGVARSFWRVALRPGKPTWFGTRGEQLVFGLPGNPVSALVTFVLFVRPALHALQGSDPPARTRAPLAVALARHPARLEAVRVVLRDGAAAPSGPQGSHVLSSMARAQALALVPPGDGELAAGDQVELELL